MYNKDSLKEQAILRFSDITKKSIEPKEESVSTDDDSYSSRAEMESKLATARMQANKEMDYFRQVTSQYSKDIKDLVLFQGIDIVIDELMIEQLLESVVMPLVKGHIIPGMPEEEYRELRKTMYKNLIDEYTSTD